MPHKDGRKNLKSGRVVLHPFPYPHGHRRRWYPAIRGLFSITDIHHDGKKFQGSKIFVPVTAFDGFWHGNPMMWGKVKEAFI
jgi:hypothetical protein